MKKRGEKREKRMAVLSSYPSTLIISLSFTYQNLCSSLNSTGFLQQSTSRRFHIRTVGASQVCTPHEVDKSSLIIAETEAEDELWAASCLRVRSFYEFTPSSYGIPVSQPFTMTFSFSFIISLNSQFSC